MSDTVTTYLEMASATQLRPKTAVPELCVRECEIKQWQLNRFLYRFVGTPWQWFDRLNWPDDDWKAYAEDDNLRTWVGYVKGSPAGYVELRKEKNGDVEIVLFGLAESFIGQGLGGPFLSQTLECAWSWDGVTRVWLHTCTMDHPSALKNYEARGMTVYRVDRQGV